MSRENAIAAQAGDFPAVESGLTTAGDDDSFG